MIDIISITSYIIVETHMFLKESTNSTPLPPVSGVSPIKKVNPKEHK